MYEQLFGFKEKPFTILPDPAYLYMSRIHRLALVHLEYGLMHRAGFIVISGDIGTGKTTLIKTLLQRLDNETEVASIFNTTVKPEEFLDLVLQEFEIEYTDAGRTEKLNRLNEFLIGCYSRGLRTVLIVDEAQNLSLETLEEIRLLSNLQTSKEYLLQIVLVGQPELRDKLAHPSLVQLAQRIAVHYHLAPLTIDETRNYIWHRLEVASDREDVKDLFTNNAIEAIYGYTKGTPRLINILCDACLVNAFADELTTVDRKVVDEAVQSQEASGFSALATARTPTAEETDTGKNKTVAAESFENQGLRSLEVKVNELQSGLVTLNRLVQERLLAERREADASQKQDITELEKVISNQNAEIDRLKSERKDLLKRIASLTAQGRQMESTGILHNENSAGSAESAASGPEEQHDQSASSGNWFDSGSLKPWLACLFFCIALVSAAVLFHGSLRDAVFESLDKLLLSMR